MLNGLGRGMGGIFRKDRVEMQGLHHAHSSIAADRLALLGIHHEHDDAVHDKGGVRVHAGNRLPSHDVFPNHIALGIIASAFGTGLGDRVHEPMADGGAVEGNP